MLGISLGVSLGSPLRFRSVVRSVFCFRFALEFSDNPPALPFVRLLWIAAMTRFTLSLIKKPSADIRHLSMISSNCESVSSPPNRCSAAIVA